MLRVATVIALLLSPLVDLPADVEVTEACPAPVVLPNFSGMTVASAQTWVLNAGLGGLLVAAGDQQPHVPSQSEMNLIILRNAPNSPPGVDKSAGEWVGTEIP